MSKFTTNMLFCVSILWQASEEKQSSNDNLCKPLFINLQQSCIVCNQWLDTVTIWNLGCPLCNDFKCCNHWRAGQCGRGHYWSLLIACKQASDAGNGIRWSTDVATTSTWEWWCTWSKVGHGYVWDIRIMAYQIGCLPFNGLLITSYSILESLHLPYNLFVS